MNQDQPPSAVQAGRQIDSTPDHRSANLRSPVTLSILALCAILLFSTFIALGNWQVRRLIWKRDLIARVAQRIHAAPVDLPDTTLWNQINAESDEYRRIRVSGIWLRQFNIRVRASTILGRGFWLMTPLRTPAGQVVWINRGFIAETARTIDPATDHPTDDNAVVTGLLRLTEPGGSLLQANQPGHQQWFSRDISALSTSTGLIRAAPFFLDAEALPALPACAGGQCADHPVGGLTVVSFPNNHLIYMITWYALALMVGGATVFVARSELRLRRSRPHHSEDRNA